MARQEPCLEKLVNLGIGGFDMSEHGAQSSRRYKEDWDDALKILDQREAEISALKSRVAWLEALVPDEAGSRLIAAAPDLLWALREILSNLCALTPDPANPDFMRALGNSNPADNSELIASVKIARNAIKKAETQS
jgi:hypothetical protein